ncbi:MAG: TAXI family TRAP transporter solute-binding subunit [Sulfurovum sp.]|nr:TAXI family TRAP transporter solute-binding subunit [Sulfurovum sp.]
MQKVYRWLMVASVVVLSISLLLFFLKPSNETKGEIKIATGSKSGMYYQYALEYQRLLKKERVEVVIVPTAGSKEAQKLLHAEKVDMAFIQGGTIEKEISENLESLASIYLEPLWIFTKVDQREITRISQLVGKRISVGLTGSGTEQLAKKLLHANGINTSNTELFSLDTDDAKKALAKEEIDVLFTVISPHSPIIKGLLNEKKLHLMNVRRTEAYALQFPFLTHFTVPEGSFDLLNNIPSQDVNLISTVATLAVHKDFPPELIRLLVRVVKHVHKKETLFTSETHFPSSEYLELPTNKAAVGYLEKGENWLERTFPYWIAYNIIHFKLLLIPMLTLLLPLFKGVMPFYKWRVRRRIYHWYEDLLEIEGALLDLQSFDYPACKKKLEILLEEILEQTKVPLSYAGELYALKLHVEFVLERIEKEKKIITLK